MNDQLITAQTNGGLGISISRIDGRDSIEFAITTGIESIARRVAYYMQTSRTIESFQREFAEGDSTDPR